MKIAFPSISLQHLLSACVTLAAGWAFYSNSIAPLGERERQTVQKVAEMQAFLAHAQKEVKAVQSLEEELGRARVEHYRLTGDVPQGSAMVWLPDRLKQHFGRHGIRDCTAQFNTSIDEPALPGYERTYWAVNLPLRELSQDLETVFMAVSNLEQTDPIVRIVDAAVRPDLQNPSRRVAVVNVGALVRKEKPARL
jgi:hypothetical protein